jgi:hypothetical protein
MAFEFTRRSPPPSSASLPATERLWSWSRSVGRMREAHDPQEENRLLEALGFCRDQEFAAELREATLGEMKSPHAAVLLRRLMANRHTGPATWQFFKSSWQELFARHAGKSLWRLLSGVSWLVSGDAEGERLSADVRTFLGAQQVDGMQRTVDQALAALELRRAFADTECAHLAPPEGVAAPPGQVALACGPRAVVSRSLGRAPPSGAMSSRGRPRQNHR